MTNVTAKIIPIVIHIHGSYAKPFAPTYEATSRPIGRVIIMVIRKNRHFISVNPAIKQIMSSGKKGRSIIIMNISCFDLEFVNGSRYFSVFSLPAILITRGLPNFLARAKPITAPSIIALDDMINALPNPNIVPPIKVVTLPGIGEMITWINCRIKNATGASAPYDSILVCRVSGVILNILSKNSAKIISPIVRIIVIISDILFSFTLIFHVIIF